MDLFQPALRDERKNGDAEMICSGRLNAIPGITFLYPECMDDTMFREFLQRADFFQRRQYYNLLRKKLEANGISTAWLTHYIKWEPNYKLVQSAVRDFVRYSGCNALDEFKGVRQILALHASGELENPGAVLAGLLSIGDRRINAILRLSRSSLSVQDVHEFTRIHEPSLNAATVEYYIDWLTELDRMADKRRFQLVCSALHLAVLHDENGWVHDRDEAQQIGFRDVFSPLKIAFEDYLPAVEKALSCIRGPKGCEEAVRATLLAWQLHAEVARELRKEPQIDRAIPGSAATVESGRGMS